MMRFLLPLFFFAGTISAQENVVQTFQSPVYQEIAFAHLTSDNQTVLAADTSGYVLLWRKNDASIAKIIRAHNQTVVRMLLSNDTAWFATASRDNSVYVWELNTGKKISEIHLKNVSDLTFNRENYLLYPLGKSLFRSPVTELSESQLLFQAQADITCGAGVQNGKYFALGLNDSLILLDAVSGKKIAQTNTCSNLKRIYSSASYICCHCADGTLQLFELSGTALRKKNEKKTSASSSSKFLLLPEQKNVLFTTETGYVKIWDWVSNTLFTAEGLPEPVTALGTAGEFILTGNSNGEVFICKTPFAHGEVDSQPLKVPSITPAKSVNERQIRFQEPVEVQTQELDIYVWDDENVDGDTISLSLNGEWILENYMVTKEKKKLTLHLVPEKKNTFVLYAENLGKAPPNTAVISFNDGNKERTLTLNSDLKRSDAVQFILKK